MSAVKPWWKSRTIVAGIGMIASGLTQLYSAFTGIDIDHDGVRVLIEDTAALAFGGIGIVAGALTIWGRLKGFAAVFFNPRKLKEAKQRDYLAEDRPWLSEEEKRAYEAGKQAAMQELINQPKG